MPETPQPHRTRRSRLTRLAVWITAALAAGVGAFVISTPSQAANPLKVSAAARGKFIGFAANAQLLCNNTSTCTSGSNASYRNIATTEFNQITPENVMKWDPTEVNDNQWNFTAADGLVAYAAANNMTVHGHALIWHQQTPGWVQGLSASAMQTAINDHIATLVGRYANNPVVTGWDVVNEAFNEDGTRRQSFWQNTLGDGYIAAAFRAARAADSNAILCYNDYNIESANAKSDAVYNLVSSLKAQGVPIDCVGMQSHLGIQYGAPSGIQAQIQRFASLGVTVRISELDIRMLNPSDSTKLATQATYYGQVVNACNAVTACSGITIWGIDDGSSWIPGTFSDQCCGLLWDSSYQPKPAYTAVANALAPVGGDTQAPTTPGTPTASGVTASQATLSWSASTDNVGVTGYDIYRAPGASGGTFASVGTSTTTSFTNTGLSAGTTYRYQVRAKDAAGNTSSFSSAVTVTTSSASDTQAPTTPTNLTQSVSCNPLGATLSWTASTDNVGVTGYDIYWSPSATSPVSQVGTSTTTSYSATGSNAFGYYQVRARDAAGNTSAFTSTIAVLPPPCPTNPSDTQAPSTPGTPTASGVTASQVSLSWSASTDNVGVTGYDIYRAPGASGGTFASVGTSTTTSFTNTGLTASTTYRYQVRARDAAGNTSAFSSPVTVTTSAGGGTGGCSATYSQTNSWPGGFQGQVTVTNTGTTTTTAWTVVMTFANGQTVTQVWGGRTGTVPASSPVTVTNETYNNVLGPNATTTFGFLGTWNSTNNAPTLTCTRTP